MFALAAFNRLLRKQQAVEEVQYRVEDAGLNTRQLKAASKALRLLDLSESLDLLQREDMMNFLYLVGMNPTPDVLDGKLRLLRVHKLHNFTWGQLAHVWSLLLRDAANEDQILERAFQFFDKDGNGEIDVCELRTTMHELGDLLTEQEICDFIAIMDVDGNGVIGYQEFLETLRTEIPEFARIRTTNEELQQRQAALAEEQPQRTSEEQQTSQMYHQYNGHSEDLESPGIRSALDTAGTLTPRQQQAAAAATAAPVTAGKGARHAANNQRSSAILDDEEQLLNHLAQPQVSAAAGEAYADASPAAQQSASLWQSLDAEQPTCEAPLQEQPATSIVVQQSSRLPAQEQQQQQSLHARSPNRKSVPVQLLNSKLRSGQTKQQQASDSSLQAGEDVLYLKEDELTEMQDVLPGQL